MSNDVIRAHLVKEGHKDLNGDGIVSPELGLGLNVVLHLLGRNQIPPLLQRSELCKCANALEPCRKGILHVVICSGPTVKKDNRHIRNAHDLMKTME